MTVIFAALSAASLLTITACKQFLGDPEEFLSYWSSEVFPADYSFDKPYQTTGAGALCIPSANDVTLTIKLRNPKNFTIVTPASAADTGKVINFPGLSTQPTYGTDYTLEQTPDKAALKLTYKPGFLKAHEWSNGNIGAEITLMSADGRTFGKKFSLNIEANTAPPKPSVTLAQTRTGQKYYVLCLKVPDMDETVTGGKLHKDMTHIEINGTKYELKINGGGTDFIKPADSAFIEASAVEKLPISGADNPPTGAWVLYYQTDVKAEYGAEKNYTITLIDEQGLVSEELKPTAKAEFPGFYVRGINGDWYNSVPGSVAGNDTSGDGSKEKPYATVAKALTRCTAAGVPYIILTDGKTTEDSTLNLESGKTVTIASLRKDTPAVIHDNRPNPTDTTPRYFITTAGTLILDSVILKANITGTHNQYGFIANSYVYGIQQNGGAVTVKGERTEIKNFAHAVEITGGTFTMEAGSICENYINGGKSGVAIEGGSTFILKGGSIKDNKATNRAGVSVEGTSTNKGRFTMTGGEISGNKAWCFGGGIYVDEYGVADISGGTIKANHAAEGTFSSPPEDVGGGGICIKKGTVNFTGGTIEENYIDGAENNCGAGVFIGEQGIFKMTGGTITGCKTDPNISSPKPSKGGGVFVKHGTFTMSGGKVSGNTADKGGGIYGGHSGYNLGVIEILGGEVSGNTATAGGGIYSKYKLTVSDSAQIKNNTALNGSGGGIAIPHGGTFDFTGGTVSGNTAKKGSGIYVEDPPGSVQPMKMSGSATVAKDNDVFLDNSSFAKAFITVTGPLTSTPAARLTMKDDPGLTNGYTGGRVVVKGGGFSLTLAYVGKFPITSQTSQDWTTELDTVNNKLKLKKKKKP